MPKSSRPGWVSLTRCYGNGGCPEPETQWQDPNHQPLLASSGPGCRIFPVRREPGMSASQGGVSYKKNPGDLCLGEGQLLAQGEVQ